MPTGPKGREVPRRRRQEARRLAQATAEASHPRPRRAEAYSEARQCGRDRSRRVSRFRGLLRSAIAPTRNYLDFG
jgi:hypothetical protein